MKKKPLLLPKKIKIIIYMILLIIPFGMLKYQIDNDPANQPPVIHTTETLFPQEDSNVLIIGLGVLDFTSDLFISVTINRTDGVLPKVMLFVGRDYEDYLDNRFIPTSSEYQKKFTETTDRIWINVTVTVEVPYRLAIESSEGKPTIVNIKYWVDLPKFLERETLNILFSLFSYYILIGFGIPKYQSIRLKRFRERVNREREEQEEREFQMRKKEILNE